MIRGFTDDVVRDYASGKLSFAAFSRATAEEWRVTARWLLRRWKVPSSVDEDDVFQELLLGCWLAVDRYDPARGVALRAYVRFGALHAAMRYIHIARNSKRRDGKAPARYELLLDDPNDHVDATVEAEQEERASVLFAIDALAPEDFRALTVAVESGIDEGAIKLLERDPEVFSLEAARCRLIEAAERFARALERNDEDPVGAEAWRLLASQARREDLGISTYDEALAHVKATKRAVA